VTSDAGAPITGCDAAQAIFQTHFCTLAGACHDANGSAANLDLATNGWEARLVGGTPKGGGVGVPSTCGGFGRVYLFPGSYPARGLFLDKLFEKTPPCGAQMPNLPPLLDASERECIQRWADKLTTSVPAP
jgi:hypothetical protein